MPPLRKRTPWCESAYCPIARSGFDEECAVSAVTSDRAAVRMILGGPIGRCNGPKTVCPGGLADLLGYGPANADTLAVDGNSARGSRHGTGPACPSSSRACSVRRSPRSSATAPKATAARRPAWCRSSPSTTSTSRTPPRSPASHGTAPVSRPAGALGETAYVITDLASHQASPQRLAKIAMPQWIIENRLHSVRDVTFREDASKVHSGHGPENMATLRGFAINQLRAAGHPNIAAGLREMSYEPSPAPEGHRLTSTTHDHSDFATVLAMGRREKVVSCPVWKPSWMFRVLWP
jgi:hypothetical protein